MQLREQYGHVIVRGLLWSPPVRIDIRAALDCSGR
jgi:hypothetical protein